jgi:photosystem II stability/assembly factor-like uncharacterized protein
VCDWATASRLPFRLSKLWGVNQRLDARLKAAATKAWHESPWWPGAVRMRAVRPLFTLILVPLFIVLGASIFLCSAVDESSQWSVQTSGIDTNLRGVSIATFSGPGPGGSAPVIWASGSNGVILQSKDRGATWKRLSVAGGERLDFRSIQARDAETAYVMSSGESDKSRIYKTSDGGANWKLQYSGTRKEFFLDALVCAGSVCYALSDPVDAKFVILHTVDGENWKELPSDHMPAALQGEGAFAASGTCLAVRNIQEIIFVTGGPAARVFYSSNGGGSWTVKSAPIVSGNASSGAFSIALRGKLAAIVGGDYKDANKSDRVAAYSVDAAKNWALSQQQPGGYRSAVTWAGKLLVAVGPSGEDVSNDGGTHWKAGGSLNLNALAARDSKYIWAVGPNGTVAKMTTP